MSAPRDDTTKPSRLNRKRKKRWKIADLIESGLTDCVRVAMLFIAGNKPAGRGNPITSRRECAVIGVFLCLSFSAALSRGYSVMAGCLGHPLRMAVPRIGISTPIQPVAHAVESKSGGYSSFSRITA